MFLGQNFFLFGCANLDFEHLMLVRYRREQEAVVIATLSLDLQPQATDIV